MVEVMKERLDSISLNPSLAFRIAIGISSRLKVCKMGRFQNQGSWGFRVF